MTKLNVSVTADLKPPEATIHEGSQGTTLVNLFGTFWKNISDGCSFSEVADIVAPLFIERTAVC